MKMKKIFRMVLLFAFSGLACIGCGTKTEIFSSQSGGVEFDRHVPETTVTLEDKVKQVSDAYAAIQANYGQIQKAIEDTSAIRESRQAAQRFADAYSDRIEELGKMDFSSLGEDEIDDLMSELRSMVTAAREVNNAGDIE